MRYFTADLHFNSPGTIQWFRRPFKNAQDMNEGLIRNINMCCKSKVDTLIHVGDFAAYGREKGVKCINVHPKKHILAMTPSVVLLEGNHDTNNSVRYLCRSLRMNFGHTYYNVSIGHYPSNDENAKNDFRPGCIRICGHVHTAWKHFWDQEHDVLNINVGCDMWHWYPVSEINLVRYIVQLENRYKRTWSRFTDHKDFGNTAVKKEQDNAEP